MDGGRGRPPPLLLLVAASAVGAGFVWLWRWQSKLQLSDNNGAVATDKPVDQDLPPAIAEQAKNMRQVYTKVHDEFVEEGLDLAFIESMHSWFHGWQPGETTWPKQYVHMDPPLPPHTVRLLVLPLNECPGISSAAAAAAAKVAALLPPGTKIFSNSRMQYHCTVFHTSHPTDPRPDPFSPSGGLSDPPGSPHERAQVTPGVLLRERQAVTELVASMQGPELEVVSVVMAKTGTLLLTWIDRSGLLAELRSRMRSIFPGASTKQASIVHTSLLRVVGTAQLPSHVVASIDATCAHYTSLLRGRRYRPPNTWWIDESEFSTIVGDRTVIPFTSTD